MRITSGTQLSQIGLPDKANRIIGMIPSRNAACGSRK